MVQVLLEGAHFVVRGRFNAAIFSPAWLAGQGLIGPDEIERARIEVITSEVAAFSTGWLNCQVTEDALVFQSTQPGEYGRLRDAVLGTLAALPHTPIVSLGMNRELHLKPESVKQWHAIGDTLAPKEYWQSYISLPGMRQVSVVGVRPDFYGGQVMARVEPSLRFPGAVFVGHYDHFNLTRVDSQPDQRDTQAWEAQVGFESTQNDDATPAIDKLDLIQEILIEAWDGSLKRADALAAHIMGIGR